ncbi:MAG: hypothetical protein WBQ23_10065 [Bacteroidota bacterium]
MNQPTNEGAAFARAVGLLIACAYLFLLHIYLVWDAVIAADAHVERIVRDITERDSLASEVARCPMHPWQRLYEGRAQPEDTVRQSEEDFPLFDFRSPRGIAISREYLGSVPTEKDLPYPGRFTEDSLDYSPLDAFVGTKVCPACQDIAIIRREVRCGNYLVLDTIWRFPEFRIYVEPFGDDNENDDENRGDSNNTDDPVLGGRL